MSSSLKYYLIANTYDYTQAIAKSKYDENIFPGNHVSVWGSYFDIRSMRWGFSCCHSLTFKSYCTGEAGKVRDFL